MDGIWEHENITLLVELEIELPKNTRKIGWHLLLGAREPRQRETQVRTLFAHLPYFKDPKCSPSLVVSTGQRQGKYTKDQSIRSTIAHNAVELAIHSKFVHDVQ